MNKAIASIIPNFQESSFRSMPDPPGRSVGKQGEMAKKIGFRPISYGLIRRVLSLNALAVSLILTLSLSACSLPRLVILDDPLSPDEHISLGVAYEKNGELDAALGEYEKASRKNAAAYLYIGNVFFQKNEYEKAESYYRKAIGKDPGNADAYNNLAWLYFTQKRNLDEARLLAEKAIELNPSKKDIYQDTLDNIIESK